METDYSVKSLDRALRVLECFSVQQPELGITEIAKQLNMHKSTVHNILITFEKNGYIAQNPRTNKYYLGLKVLHLSYIVNHHLGLREMFLPYLRNISDACHETCYFGILDNHEVLYIEAVYPTGQQQTRNILGDRAPLHCTGLGKAMLAFLPQEEIEKVLQAPLQAFTPFTLTDVQTLRLNLQEVRNNFYAIDNMEHEFGVRCVAVPIFDAGNRIIGAVSVSGPSPRFDQETIARDAQLIASVIKPLQNCL